MATLKKSAQAETARPHLTLVRLVATDRAIRLNEEGELILTRLNHEGHREQSRTKIIGST